MTVALLCQHFIALYIITFLRPENSSLCRLLHQRINFLNTRDEIAEFANSVDLDEVALYEPPHLDVHSLPSSLSVLDMM